MTETEIKNTVISFVENHKCVKKVLLIGPDFTRFFSNAGLICNLLYHAFHEKGAQVVVLEALGTHSPMTQEQIQKMYGDIPLSCFVAHNWRNDVETIGKVDSSFVKQVTDNLFESEISCQVNRLVIDPSFDLIISVGQVVPHEVIGMANHTKNIFVGTGGFDMINKSHMAGAVYGMEKMMGKADTPVRKIFDYCFENFLKEKPIWFFLTVCTEKEGIVETHGLFIGQDRDCFNKAVSLSQKINIDFTRTGIKKCVVFMNPEEFKTTWLANKAIYRTRMAIADGGELIILAPGVTRFGEDSEIDKLIRKYGYRGRNIILKQYENNEDLHKNASVAAHLIHGSSEGRFSITYCVKNISVQEIQDVGFKSASYDEMIEKYNPEKLSYGYNIVDGEKIYYIPNPALGLWINKEKF